MFEWYYAEMPPQLLVLIRLPKYLGSASGAANEPGFASVTNLLSSHLTLVVACSRLGDERESGDYVAQGEASQRLKSHHVTTGQFEESCR